MRTLSIETTKEVDLMNIIQKSALLLTIIGAINWGLIGIFDFNLISSLFGVDSVLTKTIYVLVGVAGITNILLFFVDLDNDSLVN